MDVRIVLSDPSQPSPPPCIFPSLGAFPDPKQVEEYEGDALSDGSSADPSRCSSYSYDPANFPRLQEYEEFRAPSYQSAPSTPSISRVPSSRNPADHRIHVQVTESQSWSPELQKEEKVPVPKPSLLRLDQLRAKLADLSILLDQWSRSLRWDSSTVVRYARFISTKAQLIVIGNTGMRKGFFFRRPVVDLDVDVFRRISFQLDDSIDNLKWLLRIVTEGSSVDDDTEEQNLVPLANQNPTLWYYVWKVIAKLLHGMHDEKVSAAKTLVSFCKECGLGSRIPSDSPILQELISFLVIFALDAGIYAQFDETNRTIVAYVLRLLCCQFDGAYVVIRYHFDNYMHQLKKAVALKDRPTAEKRLVCSLIQLLITSDETSHHHQQDDPSAIHMPDEWRAATNCIYFLEGKNPGVVGEEASTFLFGNIPVMPLIHLVSCEPKGPALILLCCIARHATLEDPTERLFVCNLLIWVSEEHHATRDKTIGRLILEAMSKLDQDQILQ